MVIVTFKSIAWALGAMVLLTGTLAAVWAWAPDRSRRELEMRYTDSSTVFISVLGIRLRVRDSGPRDAPAVVFLHGFGSSLETWEPWARALAAQRRVIRFDFPGAGLSGADLIGDYDDERTLQVVAALMDALKLRQAAFVGNSMGGRIAWEFTARHPDRVTQLVLISPDGFASPGFEYDQQPHVPGLLRLMKYFLPKRMLRVNLSAAYADPRRLTDASVDRYYDLLLAAGNRDAMLSRMTQTVLRNPVPILKTITTPTLLVWGEKDRMIPYRNAADYLRALPNASLVSFPDLGHLPHEEAPSVSLPAIRDFLSHPP